MNYDIVINIFSFIDLFKPTLDNGISYLAFLVDNQRNQPCCFHNTGNMLHNLAHWLISSTFGQKSSIDPDSNSYLPGFHGEQHLQLR